MAKFQYYRASNTQWYWRLLDGNNKIIADGSEGYTTEYGVQRAIQNVINEVSNLKVR